MNAKDLAMFAAVAVAAYWFLNRRDVRAALTTEVANNALPGQTGYGWRYFSDGVAISPDGTYYKGGKLIYSSYDGVSVGANYSNLTT